MNQHLNCPSNGRETMSTTSQYLVPNLVSITNCPYYWGSLDRFEAEAILDEVKKEGSFLLRDSSHADYIFSVSFRRYNRSIHARIEESHHRFTFDSQDPGVFSSQSIQTLIRYFMDPRKCMVFDPMLVYPIHRKHPLSLRSLSRAVICDSLKYQDISALELPASLKKFLTVYSYTSSWWRFLLDTRNFKYYPQSTTSKRHSKTQIFYPMRMFQPLMVDLHEQLYDELLCRMLMYFNNRFREYKNQVTLTSFKYTLTSSVTFETQQAGRKYSWRPLIWLNFDLL